MFTGRRGCISGCICNGCLQAGAPVARLQLSHLKGTEISTTVIRFLLLQAQFRCPSDGTLRLLSQCQWCDLHHHHRHALCTWPLNYMPRTDLC
jgi:hypothetical protein